MALVSTELRVLSAEQGSEKEQTVLSNKDDSRKDAKYEAKPASSKQLAVGSNSDFGLQDSKQQEINPSAWIF